MTGGDCFCVIKLVTFLPQTCSDNIQLYPHIYNILVLNSINMIELNIIQGSELTGVNPDSGRSHIPSDNWDSRGRHTSVILVKLSTNQELIDQICFKQQSGDINGFMLFFSKYCCQPRLGHTFRKLSAEF